MEALALLLFIACMVLLAMHIEALRTHKRELVSAQSDVVRAEAANQVLRQKFSDLIFYCTGGRMGDASYPLPQMLEAIEQHYRQRLPLELPDLTQDKTNVEL